MNLFILVLDEKIGPEIQLFMFVVFPLLWSSIFEGVFGQVVSNIEIAECDVMLFESGYY